MLKVISYAMFHKFYDVLPVILRAHHSVFPGWAMWLHHDAAVTEARYWPVVQRLHDAGLIKLVHVPGETRYTRAMLWRLMPIWEGVDFVFCRDLDALPQPKERRAVEQFVASPYSTHGINDNPSHTIPLMGGLCGFHAPSFIHRTKLVSYDDLVAGAPGARWSEHGTDQLVLAGLWPKLADGAMVHRMWPGDQPYSDCHCVIGVPDVPLDDVHPLVAQYGDSFINHCGAAGCNTDPRTMMRFYESAANDAVRAIVDAERAEGCPPPSPPMPEPSEVPDGPVVHA